MIVFAIARILIFMLDASWDAYLADAKQEEIKHYRHVWIAAVFHIALSVIGFFVGLPVWFLFGDLILLPSMRWVTHDLTINILRGNPWNYTGEGSYLDRKFGGNILIKIGFLLACLAAAVGVGVLIGG